MVRRNAVARWNAALDGRQHWQRRPRRPADGRVATVDDGRDPGDARHKARNSQRFLQTIASSPTPGSRSTASASCASWIRKANSRAVLIRSDTIDCQVPMEWSRDGKAILVAITRPDHTSCSRWFPQRTGPLSPIKELGTDATRARESVSGRPSSSCTTHRSSVGCCRSRHLHHPAPTDARSGGSSIIRRTTPNPVWTADGRRVLFVSDRSGDDGRVERAGLRRHGAGRGRAGAP